MRLFALGAAIALVLPAAAQVRTPGGASIEGTVLNDLTDRPLARVRIALKKTDAKQPVTTVTDESGRFRVDDLTPGVYSLIADREAYLRTTAVHDGRMATQSLMLWRPGQRATGLTVRMRPGAVIAGKIRYRDGDPAIGIPVHFYLQADLRGRRSYALAATSVTNDLGEYRAHSLVPGAYYVVARVNGSTIESENAPPESPREEAVSTFYPSGNQLAQANAIRVGSGQEVGGCDFVLGHAKTFRVSGRVVSALTGQVVMAPGVSLRWPDGLRAGSIPAVQAQSGKGTFSANGIAPGTYLLSVEASENGRKLSARQTIAVTDSSPEGLDVVAGPVRKWSGTVRFDRQVDYPLSSLHVRLEPRSELAPAVTPKVDADGSFEAELVADETYDAFVESAPADAYLKSAVVGGAETINDGFHVPRNEDKRTIALLLSTEGSSVSGLARSADGAAAPAALVVMLPQPLEGRLQAVAASLSDENGNFLVRGLSPGRYLAVAWPSDTHCGPFDPSPPPECTSGGRGVNVGQGDVSGVNVVLAH